MSNPSINMLLPRGISRRSLMQLLGGAAGLSAAGGPIGMSAALAQARSLNYFTWSAWAGPEFVEDSKKKVNIDLKATFYSSSDEMMAKLRGGGTRIYDMIVPVQSYIVPAIKADLIEPINPAVMTHTNTLFPQFQKNDFWNVDGKCYGVPFVWGANALAYNRKETGEIDDMDVLFNPKFKGRIALRDEAEDSLGLGAMRLGIKKPFSMGERELQEVKKLLISQKPLVRAYWKNFADVQNMLASGEVVVAWTFLAVIAPLRKAGIDAGWVWPKEGALGFQEAITPVKGTKNMKLVEEYANFTISPEYGEFMARNTRYAPASKGAVDRLEPALVKDIGIDTSKLSRLVFKEIPPNKPRWEEIWNEVKAA